MNLWSCAVACSLGSSVTLASLGMDGELARNALPHFAARAQPNGIPNAAAVRPSILIASRVTGEAISHHQGNV